MTTQQQAKYFLMLSLLLSTSLYGGSEDDSTSHAVYYGKDAGKSLTIVGTSNDTFIGYESGMNTTSGTSNTFIGNSSGINNQTGKYNIYIGASSGNGDPDYTGTISAQDNVFIGFTSGAYITTGGRNIGIGSAALYNLHTHGQNVAIGWHAGAACESDYNVFIGDEAGLKITTGFENVMIGDNSGAHNITGKRNVMIGRNSGNYSNGDNNTFIGKASGYQNKKGFANTYVGFYSGLNIENGKKNTFIGTESGQLADVNNSILLGYKSGYYADRDNILMIANSDTNNSLIYGEFDTKMMRVNGTMEINSTKEDVSDAGDGSEYGYMALRINGNDLPRSETDWHIAIYDPKTSVDNRELLFFNKATENAPFSIANNATDSLLSLTDHTVLINKDEIDLSTFASLPSLLVNGDMITTFNNSSSKDVTELVSLEVNNTNTAKMSDTGFKLTNSQEGVSWTFRTLESDSNLPLGSANGFAISKKASGAKEIIITSNDDANGMQLILANGAKCVNGVWQNRSTRASKENIEALSAEEALAVFHKLQPMVYNYKTDKKEKYVGFIAEDVPDLVATNSRDSLSAMDMVAVLTKVVQVQAEKIEKLEKMQKRLTRIETLLTNLALENSSKTDKKVVLRK